MEKFVPNDDVPSSLMQIKKPALSPNWKPYRVVDVYSNHYTFTVGEKGSIHQWDAKFIPELENDSREVRNEIFALNRRSIRSKLGPFITSGAMLFSFKASSLGESQLIFGDHPKYKISLKYVKQSSFEAASNIDSNCLMVYNSGIKQLMKHLGYTEHGRTRKFYNMQKNQQGNTVSTSDFNVKILSGYAASVEKYERNIPKILISFSCKLIRTYNMLEEKDYFVNSRGYSTDAYLDEFVIGKPYLADYGNNKIYRIDGVDFKKTPMSEFPSPLKFKTFKEYFQKQYGMKITDQKQFLVYSIMKRREMVDGKKVEREEIVYLVPELLKPTGLTDDLRKDHRFMNDLAMFTKKTPEQRDDLNRKLIKAINDSLTWKPKSKEDVQDPNEMKLTLDPNSNKIKNCMIVALPEIRLGKPIRRNEENNFNIYEPICQSSFVLKNWAMVYDKRDRWYVDTFEKSLQFQAKQCGIKVIAPSFIGVETDQKYLTGTDIIKELQKKPQLELILVVMPRTTAEKLKHQVKAHCYRTGIASQFVVKFTLKDWKKLEDKSFANKVFLQMCVKRGAVLWKVQRPIGINVNGHQVMTAGVDVFHQSQKNSLASVVSTLDEDLSSFYSQISIQPRRGDDTLYSISDLFRNAARKYMLRNKHSPNIIVVYRDGVGESQIEDVRIKEVGSLLKGLKAEFNGNNVKLVYVIVSKRIEEKFSVQEGKFLKNPSGGTLVVDKDVVKEGRFEFFMTPHQVREGTAKPTNYNVIYNTSDLKLESIYELTAFQCSNYYNWSGPIKIPAVVKMANNQALEVGQLNVPIEINEELKSTFYYA